MTRCGEAILLVWATTTGEVSCQPWRACEGCKRAKSSPRLAYSCRTPKKRGRHQRSPRSVSTTMVSPSTLPSCASISRWKRTLRCPREYGSGSSCRLLALEPRVLLPLTPPPLLLPRGDGPAHGPLGTELQNMADDGGVRRRAGGGGRCLEFFFCATELC